MSGRYPLTTDLTAPTSSAPRAAPAVAVTRLTLSTFRNYRELRFEADPRPVAITGANGAGKTNLLEALSFLAPGRGLRGAKLSAVACSYADTAAWAVAARINTPDGLVEIGTGLAATDSDDHADKRVVHIDGTAQRGVAALARHLGVVWLTPAMDRLFADAPAGRRRFVDRLALAFDPDHAGRTAAFDRAWRQRTRLLKTNTGDAAWFLALEDTLARYGVAIAAARHNLVAQLNRTLADTDGPFPSAGLALDGQVDRWLGEMPAVDAEDALRRAYASSRRDEADDDTAPHRSDLAVTFLRPGHASHGQAAATCSTGEQKALLVAVVLAHARLQTRHRGHAPLLLLDEVAAHLDAERRAALFAAIVDLGAQAWLTGTDPETFRPLADAAQHFTIDGGAFVPRPITP